MKSAHFWSDHPPSDKRLIPSSVGLAPVHVKKERTSVFNALFCFARSTELAKKKKKKSIDHFSASLELRFK